jgi:hypothetical protein
LNSADIGGFAANLTDEQKQELEKAFDAMLDAEYSEAKRGFTMMWGSGYNGAKGCLGYGAGFMPGGFLFMFFIGLLLLIAVAALLMIVYKKYRPEVALRTSMTDYRKEDWLINILLYGINKITDII